MEKTLEKQKYWFIDCHECDTEGVESPYPSTEEPQKCPKCGTPHIQVQEQIALF